MIIRLSHKEKAYQANLALPIDISIPLQSGMGNPNCFYAPDPVFEPLRAGDFIGSVAMGAPVNFYNVHLNPHGNGTHTECVGHIAKETYTINRCLKQFHTIGWLITVRPQEKGEDRVITAAMLQEAIRHDLTGNTLLLRTLSETDNPVCNYSGKNPPYIEAPAMEWLVQQGVQHLVTDLPSVDREQDGGVLAAHHIFWNYPRAPRLDATITELVFMPPALPDGIYLVNHQIAPLELDAAPAKIVLYSLLEER